MRHALVLAISWLAFVAGGCGDDDNESTTTDRSKANARAEAKASAKQRARKTADFKREDQDGDRSIDRAEIARATARDFRHMDLDRDGVVTDRDIALDVKRHAARGGKLPTPRLSESLPFDLDRNGRITLAEYRRHVQRDFVARMDRDRDGEIALREALDFRRPAPRNR